MTNRVVDEVDLVPTPLGVLGVAPFLQTALAGCVSQASPMTWAPFQAAHIPILRDKLREAQVVPGTAGPPEPTE